MPLEEEFRDIEEKDSWGQVFMDLYHKANQYAYTSKEARKVENEILNRYRDVAPFDHSRIKLGRGTEDYINASLIQVEQADREYILTQGPLPQTIAHFWVMVWEQRSKAILMLNGLVERGAIKCHQYWPNSKPGAQPFHEKIMETLEKVQLDVKLISQTDKEHFTIRKCLLTDLESGQSREVLQFHYTDWPDFGLPESPASFLEFLSAVRQCGALDLSINGPCVVHCSAGIGRSGTFCLVDSCLVLIEKQGSAKLDCRQILLEMRKYRKGLIQTAEQLRFSYMAILQGSKTLVSDGVPFTRDEPVKRPWSDVSNSDENSEENDDDDEDNDEDSVPTNHEDNTLTTPLLKLTPAADSGRGKQKLSNNSSSSNDSQQQRAMVAGIGGESPTNNNLGATELRRRTREERNKKTMDTIKKIKDKQKDIEERSRFKSRIFKVGCVGLALLFSAGLVYGFFNYNALRASSSRGS